MSDLDDDYHRLIDIVPWAWNSIPAVAVKLVGQKVSRAALIHSPGAANFSPRSGEAGPDYRGGAIRNLEGNSVDRHRQGCLPGAPYRS
jgi:hypothetical protein